MSFIVLWRCEIRSELYLSSGLPVVLEHYVITDRFRFSLCFVKRRICVLYFSEGSVKDNVG